MDLNEQLDRAFVALLNSSGLESIVSALHDLMPPLLQIADELNQTELMIERWEDDGGLVIDE